MSKDQALTPNDAHPLMEQFEQQVVSLINQGLAVGVHPARIVCCLEIAKSDVISGINRVRQDAATALKDGNGSRIVTFPKG